MRLPTPRPIPISIPATALADVALLLALYFGIAAARDVDRMRLELPVSSSLTAAELGSPSVTLYPAAAGPGGPRTRYRWFDGRGGSRDLAELEEIWLEASRIADRDPATPFVVRADASVPYAAVDEVLELLEGAGARRVLLATRPPEARP